MGDQPAIAVRCAERSDVVDVRRCVEAAYGPYIDRIGKPPSPMLDDYESLIDGGVVRVAALSGRVVGLIVLWAEDDHLYIDNVAADPDARGQGIGSALMARAEAEARSAGLAEIRLYTNEAMVENVGYYARRGFIETHRGVRAGYQRIYFSRPLTAHP